MRENAFLENVVVTVIKKISGGKSIKGRKGRDEIERYIFCEDI